MEPTLPRDRPSGPPPPATVRLTLAGHPADLLKTLLFIEGVLAGETPAASLAAARLTAISITSHHGGSRRVTVTLHLEHAP